MVVFFILRDIIGRDRGNVRVGRDLHGDILGPCMLLSKRPSAYCLVTSRQSPVGGAWYPVLGKQQSAWLASWPRRLRGSLGCVGSLGRLICLASLPSQVTVRSEGLEDLVARHEVSLAVHLANKLATRSTSLLADFLSGSLALWLAGCQAAGWLPWFSKRLLKLSGCTAAHGSASLSALPPDAFTRLLS